MFFNAQVAKEAVPKSSELPDDTNSDSHLKIDSRAGAENHGENLENNDHQLHSQSGLDATNQLVSTGDQEKATESKPKEDGVEKTAGIADADQTSAYKSDGPHKLTRDKFDTEKAQLRIEVDQLRSTIENLHSDAYHGLLGAVRALENKVATLSSKNQSQSVEAQRVQTALQTKLETLSSENQSKTAETESLRYRIERMQQQLEIAEKNHNLTLRHAAEIRDFALKEKADREKLAHQLSGAENESFRLQSQLQDESSRRSSLEKQSERIRALVKNAFEETNRWQENVTFVLDRFDKSLSNIDQKHQRLRDAMQRHKREASESQVQKCIMCVSNPISVCYVPCGHRSVCPACDVMEQCPVCRGYIRERIRTFDAGI